MEESETYLIHICKHRWSIQITMKVDELGAFSQQTLWPSSTVELLIDLV